MFDLKTVSNIYVCKDRMSVQVSTRKITVRVGILLVRSE